jgi:hypothetical protein
MSTRAATGVCDGGRVTTRVPLVSAPVFSTTGVPLVSATVFLTTAIPLVSATVIA